MESSTSHAMNTPAAAADEVEKTTIRSFVDALQRWLLSCRTEVQTSGTTDDDQLEKDSECFQQVTIQLAHTIRQHRLNPVSVFQACAKLLTAQERWSWVNEPIWGRHGAIQFPIQQNLLGSGITIAFHWKHDSFSIFYC